MDNPKLLSRSILSALGVFVYVAIVAWIINNGERIFGQAGEYWGPVAFLLLFVLSATITGLLVLGRPVMMYAAGMKAEAVRLLVYTIIWLIVIVVIVFAILASI